MSTNISLPAFTTAPTLAIRTPIDLASRFGDIPLSRIRFTPAPGLATEADVLAIHDRENRLYELVDGTLIEKTMGTYESLIAVRIATVLSNYFDATRPRRGFALGADGMLKLNPSLIRIPDVSVILGERVLPGSFPRHGVAQISPHLAVEVMSDGNTVAEMERKLDEYFDSNVQEVWYVYPDKRQVLRYIARKQVQVWTAADEIAGIDFLPGFRCGIAPLLVHPADEFQEDA